MLEFRLFLATPFLLLAKSFGWVAEVVSGLPVAVNSLAQQVSDGDAEVVAMRIHESLLEEFEEALDALGEEDNPFDLIEDFSKRSESLFEQEDTDE